jgi:hypothetical protein
MVWGEGERERERERKNRTVLVLQNWCTRKRKTAVGEYWSSIRCAQANETAGRRRQSAGKGKKGGQVGSTRNGAPVHPPSMREYSS